MPLKVGMIGQIVLDTIHRYRDGVTEDLGGLAYSIMAIDSLMEGNDVISPMIRVGSDAAERVRVALDGVSHMSWDGIIEDDQPNNHVELRYTGPDKREELVAGGVGALKGEDLLPLEEFDGLLINMVSGREVTLSALSERENSLSFPIHLDLHSYLLGLDESGKHYVRRPDDWEEWLDLCDTLQVNRDELCTITGSEGEIYDMGNHVWRMSSEHRFSCLLVTDGGDGSWSWYIDEEGKSLKCWIPPSRDVALIDPTGSGDVFGAAFFYSKLRGMSTEMAMTLATKLAGFNCACSGTTGLNDRLRKEMGQDGVKEDRNVEKRVEIDKDE